MAGLRTAVGGIGGALNRLADDTYARLDDRQRELARLMSCGLWHSATGRTLVGASPVTNSTC